MTIRIGIVGCGAIAREHVRAYRAAGGVVISSVFDAVAAAAEKMAADTGAAVAGSLHEMTGQVDAVSICTPPASHPDDLRPFILAGVPALCEKPLALNAADAQRCADLAQEHGTAVMPGFCHRFHPAIIEFKKLIDAGTLGRPVLFRLLFGGYLQLKGNHRADPRVSGGGPLIDHCTHAVDLFRHLVGEADRVQAVAVNAVQEAAIEDLGIMILQTADRRTLGEITGSYSLPASGSWLEWHGELGSARVSYWAAGHPDLACRRAGSREWVPIDCAHHPDRFEGEARAFLECVRLKKPPRITMADGVAASRIIDAAYRAAREGRQVRVASTTANPPQAEVNRVASVKR